MKNKEFKKVMIIQVLKNGSHNVKTIRTQQSDDELKNRFNDENVKEVKVHRDFIEM